MIQPSPKLYPQLTKATVEVTGLACFADIYIFPVAGKISRKMKGNVFYPSLLDLCTTSDYLSPL